MAPNPKPTPPRDTLPDMPDRPRPALDDTDYKPACRHLDPLIPWSMNFGTHAETRYLCPVCGQTVPSNPEA